MHATLIPGADGGTSLPDSAGSVRAGLKQPAERREGNFVVGCLIGGAVASVLWVGIGFALYSLL